MICCGTDSSDPTTIDSHLLKFLTMSRVCTLREEVIGMSSVEKEGFQFRTASTIDGPVETWMTSAEEEMHVSLKSITKEGVFLYAKRED